MGRDPEFTRLCTLPWESFSLRNDGVPMIAPCRYFEHIWPADDLSFCDVGLRNLRHQLLTGVLAQSCQICPQQPEGTRAELREMIADLGLMDENREIVAIRNALRQADGLPSHDMMYRVSHALSGYQFIGSGLVNLFEILPVLRPYIDGPVQHLLDWGCGCGRLARHLLHDPFFTAYTGCDIDAEAVEWCQEHLDGGTFLTISPEPPVPLPDESFNAVIGYSVMTHLGRDLQLRWLAELYRLTVPGAVLALTVHGEAAAARNGLAERLSEEGFIDDLLDSTLQGIAPAGYYRTTFQSRIYTETRWCAQFEILDYRAKAILDYQDLVILRRK